MLCAASVSTWAKVNTSDAHISIKWIGNDTYRQLTIGRCGYGCTHTLAQILKSAQITTSDQFEMVTINLDNARHDVVSAIPNINAYTLNLRNVSNLGSWKNVKNQYVANVLFQYNSGLGKLDNSVVENFNSEKLYNVITVVACSQCEKAEIDAYVNKPGMLANGLQYISELLNNPGNYNSSYNYGEKPWWNDGTPNGGNGYKYYHEYFKEVRLSGYIFARDIMTINAPKLTPEGHLTRFMMDDTYQNAYTYCPGSKCDNPLAPSYNDPNVIFPLGKADAAGHGEYGGHYLQGAMMGSNVYKLDLTNAQFGEWKEENGKKVFKYYPADMTLSMLQDFAKQPDKHGNPGSIAELYLPTSPTQYIIPEGFLRNSVHLNKLCIPANYTEIDRFAFLNDQKGISRYTTTAAKDGEMLGILKGQEIDNGPKTLTLPSTMKFVGRGAFSGYGGAALLEDVYVLAEEAPVCEFYAFDQKTYVGEDSHDQDHLITKDNYVNVRNGMAMLHFPNTKHADGTLNQKQMLNYSDMTRKYRLRDESGAHDNVGKILVWPTQAQYNRSFNQALAGVTWWAWKENIPEPGNETAKDNPEYAFAGGKTRSESWIAGCGDEKATHEAMFSLAAKSDGFSEKFITSYDDDNPYSSFDPSMSKGSAGFNSAIAEWDEKLLSKAYDSDENARPLSYDFVKYGGWHQFTIAELYDFMLEKPGPKPDDDDTQWFDFARYNKNIWYSICFDFALTKAQLLKAFGNEETGEYPFLSTLASVVRDAKKTDITVVMSKNLLKNKLQFESSYPNTVKYGKDFKPAYTLADYGDNDIVIEANKPYFILPCLPEKELLLAATGQRKYKVTKVKKYDASGKEMVKFPEPIHVHAVNGDYNAFVDGNDKSVADTAFAFNYYLVGNYIPVEMPMHSYYLAPSKKSNGEDWSSFYHNYPKKDGVMWDEYTAIVMAKIDDKIGSRAKGQLKAVEQRYSGKTHNYIWNAVPHNDWIFFDGTTNATPAKSAFGMKLNLDDDFTTSIQLPDDYEISENEKIYNLNGQFVGLDSDNMPKGIYVVGGKKIVK